jgi:hypothetical protein
MVRTSFRQELYNPHFANSSSDIGANELRGTEVHWSFTRSTTGCGFIGKSVATGLPWIEIVTDSPRWASATNFDSWLLASCMLKTCSIPFLIS